MPVVTRVLTIETSAPAVTANVDVALLLAGFVSGVEAEIVAVSVNKVPFAVPAGMRATMVNVDESPCGKFVFVAVIEPPDPTAGVLTTHAGGALIDTNVSVPGSVSASDSDQTDTLHDASLFLQDAVHVTDRWIVVGGVRLLTYSQLAGKGRPFRVNTDLGDTQLSRK